MAEIMVNCRIVKLSIVYKILLIVLRNKRGLFFQKPCRDSITPKERVKELEICHSEGVRFGDD